GGRPQRPSRSRPLTRLGAGPAPRPRRTGSRPYCAARRPAAAVALAPVAQTRLSSLPHGLKIDSAVRAMPINREPEHGCQRRRLPYSVPTGGPLQHAGCLVLAILPNGSGLSRGIPLSASLRDHPPRALRVAGTTA